MFKTVKSKVLVSVFLLLTILASVFLIYVHVFRIQTKLLMLKNYSLSINSFVQDINEKMIRIEDNSRDLALIGNLFYRTDRSIALTNEAVKKIFENYKSSLGGGIWFEPYVIDKNKKRLCFYVYRTKNNKLLLDESFASEKYDYHNQSWYKEITAQITEDNNTAWSLPYYENQGSNTMMITAGTGIYHEGKLIGISTVDWEIESIFKNISDMKPITNSFKFFDDGKKIKDSFSLLADKKKDYIIVLDDPYLKNENLTGKSINTIPWYSNKLESITYFNYHGKKYVPFVKNTINGMELIICIPKNEMFKTIDIFTIKILLAVLLLVLLIPSLLYISLNRNLINPIDKLIELAQKISRGEDVKIKIENPQEFAQLASAFDKMTSDIKSITSEREKINSELSIAKSIQESSLPNVFPPFPNNSEFDIYASMEPAKEVGGDFYDFFFIDNNKFMFLISDVSGKGVPAALFMMTVKTLINNLSLLDFQPEELLKNINNKICQNNSQGFFVTMFSGITNIKTGELYLVNCGHNLPLLRHKNGNYEFLKLEPNLPLGALENMEFKIYKTKFEEGDIIFSYTDGVTEALNDKGEMYGEKRLIEFLNYNKNEENVKELIIKMKSELKKFTNSVEQSDDITMLAFKYKMPQNTYKNEASIENCTNFFDWLHKTIEPWNLNNSLINKIDVCAEEIFINIASYAYSDKKGEIEVSIVKVDDEVILEFKDCGIAYNPLAKPDPDITLSLEERQPGGLGIFMVKEIAQNVVYERVNEQNILTIVFKIDI